MQIFQPNVIRMLFLHSGGNVCSICRYFRAIEIKENIKFYADNEGEGEKQRQMGLSCKNCDDWITQLEARSGPLAAAYQQFCMQLSHAMRYKILRENDNIVQTNSSKLVYPLFLYNERSSSSCIVDMKN